MEIADSTEFAESNLTNFGNLVEFLWQGRFLGIGTVRKKFHV